MLTELTQIRYGMALWLLQENAGLSYKEARAYLADYREETPEYLAKMLGIKKQTVYDLRSSAKRKLDGKILDEILMGYTPLIIETCSPVMPLF